MSQGRNIQTRNEFHCTIKQGRRSTAAKTVAVTQLASSPPKHASSPPKVTTEKVKVSPRLTNQTGSHHFVVKNDIGTKKDNLEKLEEDKHVRMSEVFPMSDEMKIALKSLGNLDLLPDRAGTSLNSRRSCSKQVPSSPNCRPTKLKFGNSNIKTLRPMLNKVSAYKMNAVGDSKHQDVQMFQERSRTNPTKMASDTADFDRLLRMHSKKKDKRKLLRANTVPKSQHFGVAGQVRERSFFERSFGCSSTRAWEMKSEDPVLTRPRASTFSGFEKHRNDKTGKFLKRQSFDWDIDDKVDTFGDPCGLHRENNATYRRNHFRKSLSQSLPRLQCKLASGDIGTEIALKCEKWFHWRSIHKEPRTNESDEETETST